MDFSTPTSSLSSLLTRHPPLPPPVHTITATLLSSPYLTNPLTPSLLLELIEISGGFDEPATEYINQQTFRWEPLAVSLNLCVSLLGSLSKNQNQSGIYMEGPRLPLETPSPPNSTSNSTSASPTPPPPTLTLDAEFQSKLLTSLIKNLTHPEPRLRTLVAKCLGAHARCFDPVQTYAFAFPTIWQTVLETFKLSRLQSVNIVDGEKGVTEVVSEDGVKRSTDSKGALDDTTGWRGLETSLYALAALIEGCGVNYLSSECKGNVEMDDAVLEILVYCANVHVNRHVKAAGLSVFDTILRCCYNQNSEVVDGSPIKNVKLFNAIVEVVEETLSANWSQVRMASSVLTRTFLTVHTKIDTPESAALLKTKIYKKLIPSMCLNRFYLAEGVKLYSQETWSLAFLGTTGGLDALSSNALAVVKHYSNMCDADNHVVREAACQAVSELCTKFGDVTSPYRASFLPFVNKLLQPLLSCFHDESWPVRNAACLACGSFVKAFKDECVPVREMLFEMWLEQLGDQIWSVRADAAVAIHDAVVAYGAFSVDIVKKYLVENIGQAKLEDIKTMKQVKDDMNDKFLHTDTTLYSCGSLAPKKKQGKPILSASAGHATGGHVSANRVAGCSDCKITRERTLWELTDGAIYLFKECASELIDGTVDHDHDHELNKGKAFFLDFFKETCEVLRVDHFPQAEDLRCTFYKSIPSIISSIGPKRYKSLGLIEPLLNLLVKTFDKENSSGSGSNQLTVFAAQACCIEMSRVYGEGIFRGRVVECEGESGWVLIERSMRIGGRGMGMGGGGFESGGGSAVWKANTNIPVMEVGGLVGEMSL